MNLLQITRVHFIKTNLVCEKEGCNDTPSYIIRVMTGPLAGNIYLVCEPCFHDFEQKTQSTRMVMN